ncbi:hypothetical protein C3B47_13170 [Flavobacterium columnare]|uniref:hypothetical protein n=1 Tax=Flavobacterium columnare TaxID=996 RepID=UPI00189663F5|nr:hypothetical protein [Flavobacterium columnare]MBF6653816.1 hypothetical protein [Flavobacterium columnare]MBF6654227.1 hypothetical protein [Flavobacterium columnare]
MSRTRIVGGKITEIVGGEYNIYSEGPITLTSLEGSVNITAKKDIKYGEPESPPIGPNPEIKPKCLVYFRPHDNYDSEFGFDWLRTGDTKKKGDSWFGNIMGKYYESDNVTVFKDTNHWNVNFKKDLRMYDRLLRDYTLFNIPWKQKKGKNAFIYPTPIITLLEGKTATFNLKIEIEELPKKLTLEFKEKEATKHLSLNVQQISGLSKGKQTKSNFLKITCNKAFDTTQTLYVKADGEICGTLKIHPNTPKFQKKINIVFVKVKTDINGFEVRGKMTNGGDVFFKKCLNQALVIPNLVIETQDLDCTGNLLWNTFKNKFCPQTITDKKGVTKNVLSSDAGLRNYLEDQLKDQFGDKYKGYYTVFFIGEKFYSFKNGVHTGYLNGFSYFNTTFGVYFNGHNEGTLAHELMHAMQLPHTFDGLSAAAKFTYMAGQTDNIMDYSHQPQFGNIRRKIIYHWQWKLLNSKIL